MTDNFTPIIIHPLFLSLFSANKLWYTSLSIVSHSASSKATETQLRRKKPPSSSSLAMHTLKREKRGTNKQVPLLLFHGKEQLSRYLDLPPQKQKKASHHPPSIGLPRPPIHASIIIRSSNQSSPQYLVTPSPSSPH